jgi:hypothetical protein
MEQLMNITNEASADAIRAFAEKVRADMFGSSTSFVFARLNELDRDLAERAGVELELKTQRAA